MGHKHERKFCCWCVQEAQRLLDRRLPVPAYDHLLKLSHTFNLLDARGAVGMTERAECFAAMRNLARQVTGQCPTCRERPAQALLQREHALEAECKNDGGRISSSESGYIYRV